MNHINFDMLYRLAECVENEQPFNDAETDAMRHIADCKECYGKFCSLLAIISVTSNSGYVTLSEIFTEKDTAKQMENISNRVMAVISIAIQKVKESVSVMMEQVEQIKDGFIFEAPLAVATRDATGHEGSKLRKLEDVENERNFITVDPISKVLLVQIDARDLEGCKAIAYITLDSGDRIDIPLSRVGSVFRGKIANIPEERFDLYIEK